MDIINTNPTAQIIDDEVTEALPQKVRWGPSDALPAGIWIGTKDGPFIPWTELKLELEERLLNQLGRHIPAGCSLIKKELFGRPDWIVRILNPAGDEEVGSIWLGSDPAKDWAFDGLVRAGKAHSETVAEVWQTFQRYSDGTYRRVG